MLATRRFASVRTESHRTGPFQTTPRPYGKGGARAFKPIATPDWPGGIEAVEKECVTGEGVAWGRSDADG